MTMYPENIMQKLRQRRGLEPFDTSQDTDIYNIPKDEAFCMCLEWEGIIGYSYAIKDWIFGIYGITIQ